MEEEFPQHNPPASPSPPVSNALTAAGCHTIQLTLNPASTQRERLMPQLKASLPTRLPHFRCPSQVQVVNCASEQMAMNQRFMTPPLGFIKLFKWLTELRKPVYSLDYLFCLTEY